MAKRDIKIKKDEDVAGVVMETTVVVEEPEPKVDTQFTGVLINTKKLNIRKSPSIPKKNPSSNVIATIDDKATIVVDTDKSNDNWYKVTVNGDISGYCMKDYITVK